MNAMIPFETKADSTPLSQILGRESAAILREGTPSLPQRRATLRNCARRSSRIAT
jgi:hypothetical protein